MRGIDIRAERGAQVVQRWISADSASQEDVQPGPVSSDGIRMSLPGLDLHGSRNLGAVWGEDLLEQARPGDHG